MPEIAIMIEGQNGLNWPRWKRLALAVESLGFAGLFRSDHYVNALLPDRDSLELWVSLTWLADHTNRIEFGPLVSPVSFRHPTMTARMAAAVDDLSGGRLILGLGAGWQEREHKVFGRELLDIPDRFTRLEEGVQVVSRLLHSDQPVNFDGQFFTLQGAILYPRPRRAGGPPILIGGNSLRHTLPIVAHHADAWNAVFIPAAKFQRLNQKLDELLSAEGRQPQDVQRSLMTGCILGRNSQEVAQKVALRTDGKRTIEELALQGTIIGTPQEFVAQLNQLDRVGVKRVMLQWIDLDDVEGLETLAGEVLPNVEEKFQ